MYDNKFEIFVESSKDGDRIVVVGDVGENSEINFKYFEKQISDTCFVDLENIKTVNSIGLAKIIKLLGVINDRTVFVEYCPESLMTTVMTLPQLKNVHIKSFKSTLECAKCLSDSETVVEVVDGIEQTPNKFCSDCGEKLNLLTSLNHDF